MEIQFLRDVRDPDTKEILHHKGERYHCKTSVGDDYIERKAAEKVRYASYVDRLRAAATAPRQVHANDDSVAAPVLPVGFGIVKRVNGTREQWFIQEVTAAGSALIYEGVPAGCPASVVKKYQELNGADVDPAVAAEAARIAQCERHAAELANKEVEKKNYFRIFGGK